MYIDDEWPEMTDGSEYDGRNLLALVQQNESPFHHSFDVNLLIDEVEEILCTKITDIPRVYKGSNNYGFHIKLADRRDILARLARGDVNMPDFDGVPLQSQVSEVKFEANVYELLQQQPRVLVSRLLYHRIPVQRESPRLEHPKDLAGRRLFLFERAEGENNIWKGLNSLQKAANIRASLYNFDLSTEFVKLWLRERFFEQRPKSFPIAVAPTREFCIAFLESKIEATIRDEGDMIGWESDHNVVGPIAAAAKRSILQLIPYIVPETYGRDTLYRFVLEHGDFGIHNMSIAMDAAIQPLVTSLYDWETAFIVPALLSDPLMAVTVDLGTDEDANPSLSRLPSHHTPEKIQEYSLWSKQYIERLFVEAPSYRDAIRAGKDARHLWFALRDWRGDDPEGFFGNLGSWAEKRFRELGV